MLATSRTGFNERPNIRVCDEHPPSVSMGWATNFAECLPSGKKQASTERQVSSGGGT